MPNAIEQFAAANLSQLRGDDGGAALSERVTTWMRQHRVVFDGEVIPFVLAPHALKPLTMRRVQHAVNTLTRILNRFCASYPRNARLQQALDLTPAEHDLVCIQPTLDDDPLQLCRLDAFLMADGAIQFLEFNAESPAGIGYTDVMFDGLAGHLHALRDPRFVVDYERITEHLIRTVRDVHDRWRAWALRSSVPHLHDHDRARVVLVDASGSPSIPEFEIICDALRAAGFDADHAALSDLELHDGRLHARGRQVDVVYRRALVDDILDLGASLGAAALLAAVRDGAVAMFNPFPARIANNKKLLALLDDPRFSDLVIDDDERRIVRETIPWTRVLDGGTSTLPDGSTGDLQSFIIAEQSSLVLKPASDYGGHNVHLGCLTEPRQWSALTRAHAGTGDWIVQQYLSVPEGDFPAVDGTRVDMRKRHFNINPFSIGGRYAGMITRISDNAVINVSAGGGLLPCVSIDLHSEEPHHADPSAR